MFIHHLRNGRLQPVALAAALFGLLGANSLSANATNLADAPIFSNASVPGNLALALSVEWPTASRTAHTDAYSRNSEFLGYFDPNKCYAYRVDSTANSTNTGDSSNFYPVGAATNRTCVGDNDNKWSGNFLNWASTSTIDPFRWAMTGGRRVVDTATETILEKAWHSGQGLFPDRDVTVGEIAGATPYNSATRLQVQVGGRGFKMRLNVEGNERQTFTARYYRNYTNTSTTPSGTATLRVNEDTADHVWGDGAPGTGVEADNFYARYDGVFTAPETGNYVFATESDDGVRVWLDPLAGTNFVNATRIIDNWTDHGVATDYSSSVYLTAGQSYSIRVAYYEKGGGATLRFLWRKPTATNFAAFGGNGNATNDFTMRVKVCDPSAGDVEGNCKAYGSNYKPEGLIQKYSERIRFSAFGYLNDSSGSNSTNTPGSAPRDGGVMRARQKFVGPMTPVPGSPSIDNARREWDPQTGVFEQNPDSADAAAAATAFGVSIADSGVMNYLNKFGQLYPGNYKSFDPVSEMYYAVLRYYRNLGNVPAWTDMSSANADTKRTYVDGFPVITDWDDPIQYSCQRNFVLGIGDIYTHVDKNVPGNSRAVGERSMPSQVSSDTTVNAVTATNKVGSLQNFQAGTLGNYSSGRNNSYYMAGLAYDANTTDIRPDVTSSEKTTGRQSVQTYWVDVLEAAFEANNQFYLTAKFGGMSVPDNFSPYAATTTSATIQDSWWRNSTDTVGSQPRPDNYFTGGKPKDLIAGLTKAFESISNKISEYTTSFAPPSTTLANDDVSYSAQYDAKNWSGTVSAQQLKFVDGAIISTPKWSSKDTLLAQFQGTGWNTGRSVVTWNGSAGVPFRAQTGGVTAAQLAQLSNSYGSSQTTTDYLNYLRGDRTYEMVNGGPYRTRTGALLGDIVNAKLTVEAGPGWSFQESVNPGYSAFVTSKKNRPTMVYVAANDGMLHAINGNVTDASGGKERFAYIPSALFGGASGSTPEIDGLAQLGNPQYIHRFFVDATPKTFDIDFNRAGGTLTTTKASDSDWRTVLVGGLGKGGKGFYAIDVTNPGLMNDEASVASKVLWEFSGEDMGYSFGEPVAVRTRKYGWVIVLTSGYRSGNDTGNGYLYIVNPRNGQLLERISTGETAPGMTQASAYVPNLGKMEADAVYVGDLNGAVWRFDLTASSGAYPAPVKLANLTDRNGAAQPITTAPLIEISPKTLKRFVLVGTGQLLSDSDVRSNAPQNFYALLDGTSGQPSAVTTPIVRANLTELSDPTVGVLLSATSKGWMLELGSTGSGDNAISWRLVDPPTAYNGVVAFASLLTSGNACSPSGQSRVYALDFSTGETKLESGEAFHYFDNRVTNIEFVRTNGVVTLPTGELGNEGKKVRLVIGKSDGSKEVVDTSIPAGGGFRLLNWRELPTVE